MNHEPSMVLIERLFSKKVELVTIQFKVSTSFEYVPIYKCFHDVLLNV